LTSFFLYVLTRYFKSVP